VLIKPRLTVTWKTFIYKLAIYISILFTAIFLVKLKLMEYVVL